MDELEFAAQFRPDGPVTIQTVFARALMPDRTELAEAAAQRAAEDARAEERELRRMLNAQAGDPLGQLSRAETAAAALRDEVMDLEARLEAARSRLHRAAEAVVDFRTAADEVMASSARRSNPGDLLAPAKAALAEQRVERMLAERSARPQQRAARPFVSRGQDAVRSELECWYCVTNNVDHETSTLAHHDPQLKLPITTREQALAAEQAEQAAEADRLQRLGYSRETAQYAAVPAGAEIVR